MRRDMAGGAMFDPGASCSQTHFFQRHSCTSFDPAASCSQTHFFQRHTFTSLALAASCSHTHFFQRPPGLLIGVVMPISGGGGAALRVKSVLLNASSWNLLFLHLDGLLSLHSHGPLKTEDNNRAVHIKYYTSKMDR